MKAENGAKGGRGRREWEEGVNGGRGEGQREGWHHKSGVNGVPDQLTEQEGVFLGEAPLRTTHEHDDRALRYTTPFQIHAEGKDEESNAFELLT